MRRPIPLFVVIAILLSGCWWEGPPFYTGDPTDAAPITPGLYQSEVVGDPGSAGKFRLAWLPDGSIRMDPQEPKKGRDGDVGRAVLHRFPVPGHDLWVVQYVIEKDPGSAAYGILERRGDALSVTPMLDCDATAEIVRKAGGSVKASGMAADDPKNPPPDQTTNLTCSFADRATFERALTAYMATNPAFANQILFKRIGD